jgi:natural product precursor
VKLLKRFFGFGNKPVSSLDDLKTNLQLLSNQEMNAYKGGRRSAVGLAIWNNGCGGITPQ